MIKKYVAASLVVALASLCAPATGIADTATSAVNSTNLATVQTAVDLVETLKEPGLVTLFAHTDGAFAKISKVNLDKKLSNKRRLESVLMHHIEPEKVISENIKLGTVNKIKEISANAAADDGVIYANNAC